MKIQTDNFTVNDDLSKAQESINNLKMEIRNLVQSRKKIDAISSSVLKDINNEKSVGGGLEDVVRKTKNPLMNYVTDKYESAQKGYKGLKESAHKGYKGLKDSKVVKKATEDAYLDVKLTKLRAGLTKLEDKYNQENLEMVPDDVTETSEVPFLSFKKFIFKQRKGNIKKYYNSRYKDISDVNVSTDPTRNLIDIEQIFEPGTEYTRNPRNVEVFRILEDNRYKKTKIKHVKDVRIILMDLFMHFVKEELKCMASNDDYYIEVRGTLNKNNETHNIIYERGTGVEQKFYIVIGFHKFPCTKYKSRRGIADDAAAAAAAALSSVPVPDLTKFNLFILKMPIKSELLTTTDKTELKPLQNTDDELHLITKRFLKNKCNNVKTTTFLEDITADDFLDPYKSLGKEEIDKLDEINKKIQRDSDQLQHLYTDIFAKNMPDDLDIKFAINFLKNYVDRKVISGEDIDDIRKRIFGAIKNEKDIEREKKLDAILKDIEDKIKKAK